MAVRLSLADRSIVTLSRDEAQELYDQLWLQLSEAGSISAAAKVRHALSVTREQQEMLDARESEVVRLALSRLQKGTER
jgi:hypothetical protein